MLVSLMVNMNLFLIISLILSLGYIINGQLTSYSYTASNKLTTTLTCSNSNGCIVTCFGASSCRNQGIVAGAADTLIVMVVIMHAMV